MNSMPPCTFRVPKSAYCCPLMAFSAAGPCVVLSTLKAFSTVLRSPVAPAFTWSSTVPTAYWLAVWAPAAKALTFWNRFRNTLLAS